MSDSECPARVSHKSALQDLAHKIVRQGFPTTVSYKSVPQECPTRVRKSVPQRFPKRMCPTRVSRKSVSYKSVKNCLGVCFPIRVCIRVRGFHRVSSTPGGSHREGPSCDWSCAQTQTNKPDASRFRLFVPNWSRQPGSCAIEWSIFTAFEWVAVTSYVLDTIPGGAPFRSWFSVFK